MPFSSTYQSQIADLVNEAINRTTIKVPDDFDDLCASLQDVLTPVKIEMAPQEDGSVNVSTHLDLQPKRYDELHDELIELLNDGFDMYIGEKVVDEVKALPSGRDKLSATIYVPSFTSDKENQAERILEAREEFKNNILQTIHGYISDTNKMTFAQKCSSIDATNKRRQVDKRLIPHDKHIVKPECRVNSDENERLEQMQIHRNAIITRLFQQLDAAEPSDESPFLLQNILRQNAADPFVARVILQDLPLRRILLRSTLSLNRETLIQLGCADVETGDFILENYRLFSADGILLLDNDTLFSIALSNEALATKLILQPFRYIDLLTCWDFVRFSPARQENNIRHFKNIFTKYPDIATLLFENANHLLHVYHTTNVELLCCLAQAHPMAARRCLLNLELRTALNNHLRENPLVGVVQSLETNHVREILQSPILLSQLLTQNVTVDSDILSKIALSHIDNARIIISTDTLLEKITPSDLLKLAIDGPSTLAALILSKKEVQWRLSYSNLVDIYHSDPEKAFFILTTPDLRKALLPGLNQSSEQTLLIFILFNGNQRWKKVAELICMTPDLRVKICQRYLNEISHHFSIPIVTVAESAQVMTEEKISVGSPKSIIQKLAEEAIADIRRQLGFFAKHSRIGLLNILENDILKAKFDKDIIYLFEYWVDYLLRAADFPRRGKEHDPFLRIANQFIQKAKEMRNKKYSAIPQTIFPLQGEIAEIKSSPNGEVIALTGTEVTPFVQVMRFKKEGGLLAERIHINCHQNLFVLDETSAICSNEKKSERADYIDFRTQEVTSVTNNVGPEAFYCKEIVNLNDGVRIYSEKNDMTSFINLRTGYQCGFKGEVHQIVILNTNQFAISGENLVIANYDANTNSVNLVRTLPGGADQVVKLPNNRLLAKYGTYVRIFDTSTYALIKEGDMKSLLSFNYEKCKQFRLAALPDEHTALYWDRQRGTMGIMDLDTFETYPVKSDTPPGPMECFVSPFTGQVLFASASKMGLIDFAHIQELNNRKKQIMTANAPTTQSMQLVKANEAKNLESKSIFSHAKSKTVPSRAYVGFAHYRLKHPKM